MFKFRFRNGLLSRDAHIRSLNIALSGAILVVCLLIITINRAMEEQTVRLPADLRYGVRQKISDTPDSYVYSFAYYIFQQVNTWHNDGEKDFARKIWDLQAFLTPEMRTLLDGELDQKTKKSELRNRTRTVSEIAGRNFETGKVDVMGNGTWVVWLELNIKEYVNGKRIKNTNVQYPIKVVNYDVDPEMNQWGLALDGYSASGPKKLSDEDLSGAFKKHL